jgi:hypothetical protein
VTFSHFVRAGLLTSVVCCVSIGPRNHPLGPPTTIDASYGKTWDATLEVIRFLSFSETAGAIQSKDSNVVHISGPDLDPALGDRRLGIIGPMNLPVDRLGYRGDCGTIRSDESRWSRMRLAPTDALIRFVIRGDSTSSTALAEIRYWVSHVRDVHTPELRYRCNSTGKVEHEIQSWIKVLAEGKLPPIH